MVGKKVRMTAFDCSDVFHTLGQIKSIKRTIFFSEQGSNYSFEGVEFTVENLVIESK